MRIKMIVTDLDSTLLYSDETLPKESVDIINRYKKKGILFVVATSRSVASAQKIIEVLNPDAIITSGGAKAVCGEKIIYDAEFSTEDSEAIIKKCTSDKDIEFIRIIGEHIDLTNNPKVEFGEMEYGHYVKTDFQDIPKQKVSKITICCPDIEHIKELFKNHEQCCLITSYSGKSYHKLSHAKATKEDAIVEVAKYFGVSFEDILSFGDDTSDVNMLQFSKIGVAVENAKQHVKDVADYVCGSNDEQGVINYLKDNFENICGGYYEK